MPSSAPPSIDLPTPPLPTTDTPIKIYDSVDEFDRNLPPTVTLLRTLNGTKVYLIGTAHFSRASQDDVSLVMRNVRPERVVLELCPLRLHVLHYDEARLLAEASATSASKRREVFRQHGLIGGLFYLRFLNVTANITKQLGVAPGGECRRAIAEAERLNNGCQVYLGDRSIYVTMQRAMSSLTLLDKLKLTGFSLLYSGDANITAADVEQMKTRQIAMANNGHHQQHRADDVGQIPAIYKAFVPERDMILSYSLEYAARKVSEPQSGNVVGIVGVGHVQGIRQNWGKVTDEQVKELMKLPARKNIRWVAIGCASASVVLLVSVSRMWAKNRRSAQ